MLAGATKPRSVVFASGDFPEFYSVKASELAARFGTAPMGVRVAVEPSSHGDSVLIASQSSGPSSRVMVTGGSARAARASQPTARSNRMRDARVGTGCPKNEDAARFRRCGCGRYELVLRTWDAAPPGLHGLQHFEQRRAVNSVAQHLKAQGWIQPDPKAEVDAESGAPPDFVVGLPAIVLTPALPTPSPQQGGG